MSSLESAAVLWFLFHPHQTWRSKNTRVFKAFFPLILMFFTILINPSHPLYVLETLWLAHTQWTWTTNGMLKKERRAMKGSPMKAEVAKQFIYVVIPTFSNVLWWSDWALWLLFWWRRPRKSLVASYFFAVAFLSLLLGHPALSAPPKVRIQTHVRTQSSTSEGLFALLILLPVQSWDDEVGASTNQKLLHYGTVGTLCAEVNTPICNSVASLCRARKHLRQEMRELYCLLTPCSVMTPCFLYYLLLILPAQHLLLDSAEDETHPYCDLNRSYKDFAPHNNWRWRTHLRTLRRALWLAVNLMHSYNQVSISSQVP